MFTKAIMTTVIKVGMTVLLLLAILEKVGARPRIRMTSDYDLGDSGEEETNSEFVKQLLDKLDRNIEMEVRMYKTLTRNTIQQPIRPKVIQDTADRSIFDNFASTIPTATTCPEGKEYELASRSCVEIDDSTSEPTRRPPPNRGKRQSRSADPGCLGIFDIVRMNRKNSSTVGTSCEEGKVYDLVSRSCVDLDDSTIEVTNKPPSHRLRKARGRHTK